MSERCEVCRISGKNNGLVCERPATPLVQGRWGIRDGETRILIWEKMENCSDSIAAKPQKANSMNLEGSVV